MSRSIDHRIVEMRFNNRQFEEGIKESLKSLEHLKKSLDLSKAASSLSSLSEIGKNFSLDGIASSVESIADRFSTLGIIGMTVLQELTKSAIDLTKQLMNVVLSPIFEGGRRRATNIEQALFQFRGLGMDVEATMKNVLYAVTDTAYGMDEAAKVASQLGASGMRAGDDMATALRAVSGVAAMTNSSYEDIGRIFTTVAGNGRLMGNQLLQLSGRGLNVAAAIAKSMGISEGAVRDMVSKGLISFEMFYNAMDETFGEHATRANETYAGSLANVRANLAKIGEVVYLQHFENLRDIYNSLLEKIKEVQRAIIPFLDEYNEWTKTVVISTRAWIDAWDSGTIVPVFEGIKNIAKALLAVLAPIGNAFRDIFPRKTNEQLYSITRAFQAFTERLVVSEELAKNIGDTFRGFFAILDIGRMFIFALVEAILPLLGVFFSTGDAALALTGGLGNLITGVRDVIKESDIFRRVLGPISEILTAIAQGILWVVMAIAEVISGIDTMRTDLPAIQKTLSPFEKLIRGIQRAFKGLASAIEYIGGGFSTLKERMAPVISFIQKSTQSIKDFFSSFEGGDGFNLFSSLMLGSILLALKTFIQNLTSFVKTGTGIIARIKNGLDELRVILSAYQAQIKARVLMSIAIAIAVLAASLWVLSTIDPVKLLTAVGALTVLFAELVGSMAILAKFAIGGSLGVVKTTFILIALATSLLLLSFAMKKLASIDKDDLVAIGAVMAGLGVLMVALAASANFGGAKGRVVVKGVAGIVLFTIAILILASAVKKLASINTDDLKKGLISVGIIMAQLAIFMRATNVSSMGFSTGLGLIALAVALNIFSTAIEKMGALPTEQIIRGLTTMAVTLGLVTATVKLMPTTGILLKAVSLIVIAGAIIILAHALRQLDGMSGEVARNLLTLALALTIIVVAMKFTTGALAGAGALLVISGAIMLLGVALRFIGALPTETIVKSLLALVGVLVIFGVAAAILAPLIPVLFGVSGAIAVFGVAVLAAGSGLLFLGMAITAVVGLGSAGIATLVLLITNIAEIIPMFLEQVGLGIIALAEVIANNAQAIAETFKALVLAFLDVIVTVTPEILNAVTVLILGFLEVIVTVSPEIINALSVLMMALFDTAVDNVPKMVDAGMKILAGFLRGIADNIAKVVRAGIDIVLGFIRGVNGRIGEVIDMAFKTIIAFIDGLANAIRRNRRQLNDAGLNLINAIIEPITDKVEDFGNIGRNLISGLIGGVSSMASNLATAARNAVNAATTAARRVLGLRSPSKVFAEIGRDTVLGLIIGLKSMVGGVHNASENLGKTAEKSLRDTFSKISDILDDDVDLQPRITPIIDMDKVKKDLKSSFKKTQALDVSTSTKSASDISRMARQKDVETMDVVSRDNNPDKPNITVTNHYTVRNDNDIRKISQDQRTLLDRYSLGKGVPA